MHLSENDAVLISVCEPLNHIHEDTKSTVAHSGNAKFIFNRSLFY